MYGFINRAIELLVIRRFGEASWNAIKQDAGITMDGPYSILQRYDDSETYDLVGSAAKALGVPADAVLELFGEFFFEFCVEFGYDGILRALSPAPVGFIESLDSLHDHLASTYVGFDAPTFRCTREDDADQGVFTLHYYSRRPGLSSVVIGLVRSAIKGIFDIQVRLKVIDNPKNHEPGEVLFEVSVAPEGSTTSSNKLGSSTSLNEKVHNIPQFNPRSFSDLFPFHIAFNRSLKVAQVGKGLLRIMPDVQNVPLNESFDCVRPRMPVSFSNILAHLNTMYVLGEISARSSGKRKKPLRLKGQMTFQWQYDMIVFFASPSVVDLQDLVDQGLSLADLPLHDAARSLIVMSEQFGEEYEISQSLEIMTNALQLKYREIETEKGKTDRLLYSVVPSEIVDDLRHKRKVPSKRFPSVTVLFTGIYGFQAYVESHEAIQVIDLLNSCYTSFDNILDSQNHDHIYKVETVGDHYLAISGCPTEITDHARCIAELALQFMEAASDNMFPEDLKVTVGVHSGEIVTGIIGERMPRYCLFGDCINVTSRTESNGKKGYANITQNTYELLQQEPGFISEVAFTFFANVPFKGKPEPMPIWLISRTAAAAATRSSFTLGSTKEVSVLGDSNGKILGSKISDEKPDLSNDEEDHHLSTGSSREPTVKFQTPLRTNAHPAVQTEKINPTGEGCKWFPCEGNSRTISKACAIL